MMIGRVWIVGAAIALLGSTAGSIHAQAPASSPALQTSPPRRSGPGGGLGPEGLPSSIPTPSIPVPDASVPFADYSCAWPARLPLTKDGGITLVIDEPRLAWDFRQGKFGSLLPTLADLSDAKAVLNAAGIAFEEDKLQSAINFEGRGSFIARFEQAPRRTFAKRTIGSEQFVVATLKPAATPGSTPSLERTWFAFYPPKPPTDAEQSLHDIPRGVALLMPGVFGTPEGTLEATVASLRSHGWHVLRMLAQPSRFTQAVTFQVNPDGTDEVTDVKCAEIAAVLSDRAAECAYAVQGAFGHILQEHAELAHLPRIAIGFSGGAITLPVVVAREPDKYAAAVLVGGGAHYWLINAHSSYADMIAAISIDWVAPPTLEQRGRIAEAYLRHAPLDSFHTAAALRGKPTLMIQANADSAVAAVLGDVLWERAGEPDRWIRPGEHLPLFISLVKDLPAINDWLDQHVDLVHAGSGDAKIPAVPPSPATVAPKEPK